jgi:hypothetical protein
MTRTRADGACPRRTHRGWLRGHGGLRRRDAAPRLVVEVLADALGPEPQVGDGDHDHGDEGHGMVARSSRDTVEQDVGAGAVACRRLAASCPCW